jgi:hypothetical protein
MKSQSWQTSPRGRRARLDIVASERKGELRSMGRNIRCNDELKLELEVSRVCSIQAPH